MVEVSSSRDLRSAISRLILRAKPKSAQAAAIKDGLEVVAMVKVLYFKEHRAPLATRDYMYS